MDPLAILGLFQQVGDDVARRLGDHDDWNFSGTKRGQYVHDLVADAVVLERFGAEGFGVLSEESGLRPGIREVTIVVDPIDGSTNAAYGLPWYATSLCAVDAEGPVVALVINLATGDRYSAIRGEGIEVASSGRRSRVAAPSTVRRLDEAVVAFSGLPPERGGWYQYRTYGAIALDLCAVATGSFDGYVDVDRAHGVWDYLGAWLICREAGVAVVDAGGEAMVVLDPEARRAPVAGATEELLTELLALRRGWDRRGGDRPALGSTVPAGD